MGKAVFQTEIIELGEQVDAFFEEGMFVLFGENVPDTSFQHAHGFDPSYQKSPQAASHFLSFHRSEEGRRNNQKRR